MESGNSLTEPKIRYFISATLKNVVNLKNEILIYFLMCLCVCCLSQRLVDFLFINIKEN